jgi:hypothetical protein
LFSGGIWSAPEGKKGKKEQQEVKNSDIGSERSFNYIQQWNLLTQYFYF